MFEHNQCDEPESSSSHLPTYVPTYLPTGIVYLKRLGLFTESYWSWVSIIAGMLITTAYWMVGYFCMTMIEHQLQGNTTEDKEPEEEEEVGGAVMMEEMAAGEVGR